MAKFAINAEERTVIGKKVGQLRRDGWIPATIYGPSIEPLTVQFPYREMERLLLDAGGTNLIDVTVNGNTFPVLARDVQRDVIRRDILHIDLMAVDVSKTIRTEVPLVFEGTSPLVASRKGIMLTGPNSLTMEMLPGKLKDRYILDVTGLDEMGATITVKDLPAEEGVTIINDPEEMLARIVQPASARALDALERAEALTAAGLEGEEGEGEEGEEGEGAESEEGESEE